MKLGRKRSTGIHNAGHGSDEQKSKTGAAVSVI